MPWFSDLKQVSPVIEDFESRVQLFPGDESVKGLEWDIESASSHFHSRWHDSYLLSITVQLLPDAVLGKLMIYISNPVMVWVEEFGERL